MRWLLVGSVLLAVWIGYSFRDSFDPETIRGKRVLVTGASTGIGEQLVYHYARLGARLLITARRQTQLQQVIKKCREIGSKDGDYHWLAADMADMTQTKTLVQMATEKLGGLDILVLNHKFDSRMKEWRGSEEDLKYLDKTLDVNTKAYIHLASHAMPLLEQHAGSIIVLSSGFGKLAPPFSITYATSKYAVEGFFQGLRQELQLRQSPVSITVCTLGLIGTQSVETQLTETGVKGLTSPEDPADTAMAIIRGGASRARDVYYPYFQIKPLVLFRDWFTRLFEMGYAWAFSSMVSNS